jgi:NADPH:quinone reductase-like Zn-dependent oxidoreductase
VTDIPTTMRAAVSEGYGPPQAVHVTTAPVPTPAPDEMLVRVHATTVNRTDCGYRAAAPWIIRFFSGWRRPRVPILGTEFAGEVVATGAEITRFAVGDRICGWCEGTFGAHAEYLAIGENRLIARIPADRSYVEAAGSMEGSHYALGFLRRAKVSSGDRVLINGATGAIGSAAVQLATGMGATVTAVCGTDHVDTVRRLGAARVIDYQTADFTKDSERYDLVVDAVGKSTYRRCRRLLAPDGMFTSSEGWLNILMALTAPVFGFRIFFVYPNPDAEARAYLIAQIESGAFRPLVDRVYSLDDIVEAYRYVETGQKIGNVVVTVD